jgi:hypothetical protein
MAFPSTTNVDGSNPGPNVATQPDTVQSSIGNVWKTGVFALALTPASVGANTTAEQIFTATGIGLVAGTATTTADWVGVNKPTAQAGLGIVNVRVSSTDALAITYINDTASPITPTAETYLVNVQRVQPNWTKPASGNQLDW